MNHLTRKEQVQNFVFVLPALAIFSFFYIVPFFYTFWLSLHRGSEVSTLELVWFRNFIEIFSPKIFVFLTFLISGVLVVFPITPKFRKWASKGKRLFVALKRIVATASVVIGVICLYYTIVMFFDLPKDPNASRADIAWWQSVGHSFYITLWALTFQNFLAFLLALAVDKAIRTGKIYRVIFFLLPILSEVIIGLLIRNLLLTDPGIFNHFLTKFGLAGLTRDWLNDPNIALTTLAITHCWRGFGWGFIIFLAGLQTIPTQLYEAATVDGANTFQRFWRVTVPLMIPVIFLVIILTILGTVQLIGLPMALTRGGPAGATTVSVLRIYNELKNYHAGYASAEGIILGLILVTLSFGLLKISRKLKRV